MKKFFLGIFLTVAIIFCSQNNVAEAEEVDMGVYPTSGLPAFLITETVKEYEDGFDCTVVYYHKGNPYYIDYYFRQEGNDFYYSSNANKNPIRVSENGVVEYNIYKYVWLGYR